MAKTLPEIENIITAQVEAEAALNDINTTSQTGIFASIRRFVARVWQQFEFNLELYKSEIDSIAANAIPGTNKWYAEKALAFQYGDALTVINGVPTYAVVDTEAQIIKYSSSVDVEVDGVIITQVKVAKQSAGLPVKLSSAELTGFTSYLNAIKFAGTRTQPVSIDADLVWIKADIYYDGKLILAEVQTAVETAINTYLNGILYDGVLNINRLRDAIEAVNGVTPGGVDIDFVKAKPAAGAYSTIDRVYSPQSGYYLLDEDYPLNDSAQLNYIAV
jgi:hypothetical protein